jgi:hypothetical protein
MPAWIHDRARRIEKSLNRSGTYGPEKARQVAFATATQQAHKLDKTPKGYGTSEGKKRARKKYTSPESKYRKTACLLVPGYALAVLVSQIKQNPSS